VSAAEWAVTRLDGRYFFWRHPEWWPLALSAGAWMWMLTMHGHHHHGGSLTPWMVMTVAMMLPMVIPSVRTTAERSLWRRRHRAVAFFLGGYLACWAVVGVLATFIPMYVYAGAIAFAVAGAWQLTRQKRIALAGCHRTVPLAPFGWRADRDCTRYGGMIGTRCVTSCWAVMVACSLSGHAFAACAGVTAIGMIERYTWRPDHRLLSGALFAAAALSAVFP